MYAEFYRFAAPAFQLSPDVRFFFESSVHRRAMAYMVYGLRHTQGFTILTGEIGAGKTILARNLLSTLKEDSLVRANIVSSQLGGEDLLYLVSAGFGLAKEGLPKGALLQRIGEFLRAQHRLGKSALLIVDEAQNLSLEALEELRMLSNIVVDGATVIQSLLLGQPQFRARLGSPKLEQLRQRITAACHLSSLNQVETKAYIEHRLRRAEWKGDPNFTDATFSSIYQHTNGVPRRVNILCSRLLLHGSIEQLHSFTSNVVDRVANDLQRECAAAAPFPSRDAADAESRPAGEVSHGHQRSSAPRVKKPPQYAAALPPALWLKSLQAFKKPIPGPQRRTVVLVAVILFSCTIAGVHYYTRWDNSSLPRPDENARHKIADRAQSTFVQSSPLARAIIDQSSRHRPGAASEDWDASPGQKAATAKPATTVTVTRRAATPILSQTLGPIMSSPPEADPSAEAGSRTTENHPLRSGQAHQMTKVPAPRELTTGLRSSSRAESNVKRPPLLPQQSSVSPVVNANKSLKGGALAAPPAAAQSAPTYDMTSAEIRALVARGDGLMSFGDVASARLFYERAAEAGYGPAAYRLGTTFDPSFLARAGLSNVPANAERAAFWYVRGQRLGIPTARDQLKDLDR